MRRREFITLMASAAGPWSLPAQAQQTAVPLIGYFSSRSPESEAPLLPAFRRGLADAGYVENQNVRIKFQFSRGHDDRLPSIAGDLVSRKPALLVASDGPSAVAAKAATSTIPIVFSSGPDPERAGLVDRLNRPGGNATGISIFTTGRTKASGNPA
jgi:putative tryptophan/tyrosine transport system substrate-binding protein